MSKLYMMMTVTKRSMGHNVQALCEEQKLSTILSTMAYVPDTENINIMDYFGIDMPEKTVMFSVVTDRGWEKLKKDLEEKIQIDVPGMGIALLIPISSVGGKSSLQFLTDKQVFEKEEESVMKDTVYELIVIIANHGHSQQVMDAARKGGAGGGTIIHAKGTFSKEEERFLGVSIADEQEVIFIATKRENRNRIMKSILKEAGGETESESVIFSLPVADVAGLRLQDL